MTLTKKIVDTKLSKLIERIIYTEEEIREKAQGQAEKIVNFCIQKDIKELIVVIVLEGAMFIAVDLINYMTKYLKEKKYNLQIITDTVIISSYNDKMNSNREPRLIKDMREKTKDRYVLVVEDIIDGGYTLKFFLRILDFFERKPKIVKVFTMIDKTFRRETNIQPDFCCFKYEGKKFLLGKGLDCKSKFRNFPFVAELKEI